MKNLKQIYIESFDKKKLCTYISQNNAKKTIIVLHGMAEHIERYEEFLDKLILNDYRVIAYNQRGHYLTDDEENYGNLGSGDGFENLINDLDFLVNYAKNEISGPIYLFGHSMGSFVVTRYLQLYGEKIKAAIICGTGKNSQTKLYFGNLISKIICKLKGENYRSKLIDNLSFGSYNNAFKPNRTDFDWLNTVNEEVDKYINDKWCGGIFPAAFFRDFTKLMYQINKNNRLTNRFTDIFLIAGDQDPVGNMGKNVRELYDTLIKNKQNVTLSLIKNARHEILLEEKKELIQEQIIDWLNKKYDY